MLVIAWNPHTQNIIGTLEKKYKEVLYCLIPSAWPPLHNKCHTPTKSKQIVLPLVHSNVNSVTKKRKFCQKEIMDIPINWITVGHQRTIEQRQPERRRRYVYVCACMRACVGDVFAIYLNNIWLRLIMIIKVVSQIMSLSPIY